MALFNKHLPRAEGAGQLLTWLDQPETELPPQAGGAWESCSSNFKVWLPSSSCCLLKLPTTSPRLSWSLSVACRDQLCPGWGGGGGGCLASARRPLAQARAGTWETFRPGHGAWQCWRETSWGRCRKDPPTLAWPRSSLLPPSAASPHHPAFGDRRHCFPVGRGEGPFFGGGDRCLPLPSTVGLP